MKVSVSNTIKTVYCLNIAALIIFFVFTVWRFLQSSLVDPLRVTFNFGMLALLCYRFVNVIRVPTALDSVVTNHLLKMLRALAVFLMWIGVLAMVSLLFIKPITLAIFSGSLEPGLGMLPVLMYLGMAGIVGISGVLLFEATRFVGRLTD